MKCDYFIDEEDPFRCTWLAPKDHSTFQKYSITVKYGEQVIHHDYATGTTYRTRTGFVPYPGLVHKVIVRANTQPEGFPASTILNILNSGELIL